MALDITDILLLDTACGASRERRRMSRRQGAVMVNVDAEGTVIVILDGAAKRDFDAWRQACRERSAAGDVTCETSPVGPKSIFFRPRS